MYLCMPNHIQNIQAHNWAHFWDVADFSVGNFMFKVNNGNTRAWCEICSKLTIQTSAVVLLSLLLTFNIFHTLFYCFYCELWACKWLLTYYLVLLSACLTKHNWNDWSYPVNKMTTFVITWLHYRLYLLLLWMSNTKIQLDTSTRLWDIFV